MIFATALNALKRGHKIRRHHWTGYWELQHYVNDNDDPVMIMMHCYDGAEINLLDTKDILYTLENIAADDWELADQGVEVEINCEQDKKIAKLEEENEMLKYNLDMYKHNAELGDEKRAEE